MIEMQSLHSRKQTKKKYSHLMSKNTDQMLAVTDRGDKMLLINTLE